MAVQDYKINYKSDFVLTINGDAGWTTQFCIKFWTGMPSQAYFVGFDGLKYVNCRVGDTPTQLLVMFDDHHLPIGKLKMQIAYHTTIEEFPGSVFDEVTNARDVIVTIDGTDYQVMLDFTGEDTPELEFDLPAYANEAERIQNELQRQQNEADRIAAELQREQATAAAVQGAENVNAQLNGNTLTVTNRQGVSTSVNTKGEQGEQGPVGPEGPQGQTGVSITGLVKTGETETDTLYNVTFSNGTTQQVAIPKGEQGDRGPVGPEGPQGQTGVSITGLVKTGETETDTLYNITFSNGITQQVAIPKGEKGDQGPVGPQGPQGPMGDVAVITPEQQAAFTMYSTTGQNTNGPMTQKAVTDALGNIAASGVSYDNSESGLTAENVQVALDEVKSNITYLDEIDISNNSILGGAIGKGGKWTKQSSSTTNTHILIPVEVGERYRLTPNLEKGYSTYAWLTSTSVSYGNPAPLVAGTTTIGFEGPVNITPPASAMYLYVRTGWDNGDGPYRPSYFGIKTSIKNELEEETTFSSGEKVSSKGIDNNLNGRSNNLPTSKAVFDEIKAVMSLESIDLTPSLNTDLKDCWFNTTGFTSGGKHKVIPVYGNYESITITGCATDSRGSYYTFAKSYSTPSAGDPIDFCEGVSRLMVDANVTETIPIPSDCNYILIGIINASNNSYVPKALSVEAYIAIPPSNKKVEKAFKPYANSAAWNNGSSWDVTTSPYYDITGGFIYKISAENCQIKIDARAGVACYYSFLKSFTEPKNGDSIDYAGEQARKTVAAGGSTGWIDVPSECNYVWIGIANANNTIYTPELVSFRYDVVDYINGEINAVRDIAPYSYIGNSLDLRDFSLRKGFSTKVIKPNTNIGVWGNNNDLAQQSLAIYNDFIFLFYHGGYCNVLDTNTCELLYSFQMNSDISSENNHCGNACFSEKFFASDDEFPLLYLSNHLNGGECYVLRIQRDENGGFSTSSITLVQKINNAEGSAHNVAHFYPHKDKLICHSGSWYGIWDLPDVNTEEVETIGLHSDDIIEEFSTPISEHTAAGQVARNGRIFCLWYRDRGTSPRYDLLTVYNFVTKEYDAKIYLPGRLAASEFEGLDIYDGKIYIGYNKNNQIGIIEFD